MAKELGDRSHERLIVDAYGANKANIVLDKTYGQYGVEISIDELSKQSIFSINIAGSYSNSGVLYYRGKYGNYWSGIVTDGIYTLYMRLDNRRLYPSIRSGNREQGSSVRCEAKYSFFR